MSSKGKVGALTILALIIGVSGLGVGVFSAIRFQTVQGPIGPEGPQGPTGNDGTDGTDGIDGTLDNLVGFWASMNQTNFGLEYNITFHDNRFIDANYVSMSDNENFGLLQEGWYRITVSFWWDGLNITGPDAYGLWVTRNGMDYYLMEAIENPTALFYRVNSVAYIYSDGNDVFNLYCYSIYDTFYAIDVDQPPLTQFVIEFIGNP